jgi:hypothetical protein
MGMPGEATMISTCIKIFLLISLLSPISTFAQDADVKADAAISIQQEEEIWAGQQVTLNLDLKTTGFSFSNSHFNLPEVSGAFLMQTDTTTVKLTENINGETWQVVRYPLALYPQRSGRMEIPSIGVRFTTSAGFGSTEKAFEFQTRPLELTVSLPPGAKQGDMVVTTTSFELSHNWQPQSGIAQTGDAFTLTVNRRADEISAMLLPPLPVFKIEGLATYPQAPEVRDKTNRGDLTGERIDSIIWVVEKPGSYAIPGIRFQWWDPDKRELKQQIVPGLNLDIQPSPANETTAGASDTSKRSAGYYFWMIFVLSAIAAALLWLRFGPKVPGRPVDTEKSTFATLVDACKDNQPGETLSTLHAWLEWFSAVLSPNSQIKTLSEFSRICNDTRLSTDLGQLQEAIISPDNNWRGSELLNSLERIRHKINQQKIVQSKTFLAPLNP